MSTGTVKFYDEKKRLGVIVDHDSKQELSIDVPSIQDKIRDNDQVSYDIKEGKNGLTATNITKTGSGNGSTCYAKTGTFTADLDGDY